MQSQAHKAIMACSLPVASVCSQVSIFGSPRGVSCVHALHTLSRSLECPCRRAQWQTSTRPWRRRIGVITPGRPPELERGRPPFSACSASARRSASTCGVHVPRDGRLPEGEGPRPLYVPMHTHGSRSACPWRALGDSSPNDRISEFAQRRQGHVPGTLLRS